jgi:hypothetical protein
MKANKKHRSLPLKFREFAHREHRFTKLPATLKILSLRKVRRFAGADFAAD